MRRRPGRAPGTRKATPRSPLTPALVAAAAETACLLEAHAPKPGNVSPGRESPGLTYRDFVVSAAILGDAFRHGARRLRVGRLVHETIVRSHAQVGTNTHLGIVLLLAPLAKAALLGRGRASTAPSDEGLRPRLRRVLDELDLEDARRAYAAIRLARPGGMGRVPRQDVRRPPTVTLLEAMRLAAGRDGVAREYATAYEATFTIGLPAIEAARRRGASLDQAILLAFLALLAASPDTLVERRHGRAEALRLRRDAARILEAGGPLRPAGRRLLERLDRRLRRRRPPVNPGASADVVAASLFVWLLSGAETGASTSAGRAGRSRRHPRRRGSRGESPPGSAASP
jgi:triphosphoribosyl-dephospho-CoA synthase